MIDINEARNLMPSNRKNILEDIERLIVEAAQQDRNLVKIPRGFFGKDAEYEIIYNAKEPPLYKQVKVALESRGFKLGRNTKELYFVISWE